MATLTEQLEAFRAAWEAGAFSAEQAQSMLEQIFQAQGTAEPTVAATDWLRAHPIGGGALPTEPTAAPLLSAGNAPVQGNPLANNPADTRSALEELSASDPGSLLRGFIANMVGPISRPNLQGILQRRAGPLNSVFQLSSLLAPETDKPNLQDFLANQVNQYGGGTTLPAASRATFAPMLGQFKEMLGSAAPTVDQQTTLSRLNDPGTVSRDQMESYLSNALLAGVNPWARGALSGRLGNEFDQFTANNPLSENTDLFQRFLQSYGGRFGFA